MSPKIRSKSREALRRGKKLFKTAGRSTVGDALIEEVEDVIFEYSIKGRETSAAFREEIFGAEVDELIAFGVKEMV